MTTGRVLDVVKNQTKAGKDIYIVNVQVGNTTTKYQCWDAAIADKAGKDVSFDIKPAPENTTFPATMILPKGDGSSGFAKKPYGPMRADPASLAMMEESYKKDVMLKCIDIALAVSGRSDITHDEKSICKMAVDCYKVIGGALFVKATEHAAS